jgi:hypothetical protein
MALPASGPLSLSQIQGEFGGSNPISLSEYYRGGGLVTNNNTSVPTSGTIRISNFYGTVKQFLFTISSNQTNANLRTLAVSAGWDQSSPVVCTVSSGVYLSSNSTGTPGFTIGGSFPNGVALINDGFIVGMGGAGGGGNGGPGSIPTFGANSSPGGTALSVGVAATVTNNGLIAGGGGGGGGGGFGWTTIGKGNEAFAGGGGGGGGRSSNAANSSGGSGGASFNILNASDGSVGTVSAVGSGGAGASGFGIVGGNGGTGGGWGATGSTGTGGTAGTIAYNAYYPGRPGAAGGAAVAGNVNITWLAFGTRLGAIT